MNTVHSINPVVKNLHKASTFGSFTAGSRKVTPKQHLRMRFCVRLFKQKEGWEGKFIKHLQINRKKRLQQQQRAHERVRDYESLDGAKNTRALFDFSKRQSSLYCQVGSLSKSRHRC